LRKQWKQTTIQL